MARDVLLWRVVLFYALQDHARGHDTDWIYSPDFELVCDLALVDADEVLRRYDPENFRRIPNLEAA